MPQSTLPRLNQSRSSRAASGFAAWSLALLTVFGAASAFAQDDLTSKFTINDDDPVASVPTPEEAMKQPLEMGYQIMLLSERGDAATARGDHAKAAKYWAAIAKAVPDRSLGYVRMCKSYQAAGDLPHAIENCRIALGKTGVTVEDNLQFAQLVLSKQDALTPSEIEDVEAVAQHLEKELGEGHQGPLVAQRILCDLASRLSDATRMRACVTKLKQLAPDDARTLVFSWSLAILERDFNAANQAIDKAAAAQLAPEALQTMRHMLAVERERPRYAWQRVLRDARTGYALLALGLAVAMLAVFRGRSHRIPNA